AGQRAWLAVRAPSGHPGAAGVAPVGNDRCAVADKSNRGRPDGAPEPDQNRVSGYVAGQKRGNEARSRHGHRSENGAEYDTLLEVEPDAREEGDPEARGRARRQENGGGQRHGRKPSARDSATQAGHMQVKRRAAERANPG